MSDLDFFVDNFIIPSSKKRFLLSLKKKSKLQKELHKIDKHLNNKCHLISQNAIDVFYAEISQHQLSLITVVDYFSGIKHNISINDFSPKFNDSIIISQNKNIAIILFHEEWLYICKS